MNCKACRVEIEDADDARPLSSMASVHLESCTDCSTFRVEHVAQRAMIGGLEVVAAPADFDFRLRARLAALKSEWRGVSFLNRLAPSPRSFAIAAVLVVLVMFGLVIRQAVLVPGARDEREQTATTKPVENDAPLAPKATAFPDEIHKEAGRPSSVTILNADAGRAQVASGKRIKFIQKGAVTESRRDDVIDSMDMASTPPANTVLPPGIPDPMTLSSSTVAVPVRASMQSITFALKNSGADPQTISLRPVTFGGQDLFERGSAMRAIVPTVQGIW